MSAATAHTVITGAHGRLGRALLAAAGPMTAGWGRRELDLDRPETFAGLIERAAPRLVIHAAAMTDVDACAREPDLAMRRNGEAAGALASACHAAGVGFVLISTNEVFDGDRSDERGYVEGDEVRPRNAYGRAKLAGEQAASAAFGDAPGLWIMRTAWLYGPPGGDFPAKIVAAADGLPEDEALAVVDDEYGSPTYTRDVAAMIHGILGRTDAGTFHVVNSGRASRLEWAREVLAVRRPRRAVRPISRSEFARASEPPPWAVLDTSAAATVLGSEPRPWSDALAAYLARG